MINDRELLLLSYFRQNGRATLTQISKKTKIPISTIFDKLRRYQGSVIERHTALLNFSALGYNARVKVMLKACKTGREELKEYLINEHRINSVYKINNGYDFLIEGIFRDIKEIQEFLEKLEENYKISDKRVFYIIDDLKREAFLSNPKYLQLVKSRT